MAAANAITITFARRSDPTAIMVLDGSDPLGMVVRRMVEAGAQPGTRDGDSASVYHFDGQAGRLLLQAARLLAEPACRMLGCAAVVAVKVMEGGRVKPSPHTEATARKLAQEAPAGRLLLSLRLATLLELTEAAFARQLKPVYTQPATGSQRPAMAIDLAASASAALPATPSNGAATLAGLDEPRRERLAEKLAARLVDDLGPIAPVLVARVFEDAASADDLVRGLAPYMSKRGAARLDGVVGEELRLAFQRGAR